jgi:hypothetical protein
VTSWMPYTHSPGRPVFVLCPECAGKVRLAADGWGYCRHCGGEFRGRAAPQLPQVLPPPVTSRRARRRAARLLRQAHRNHGGRR